MNPPPAHIHITTENNRVIGTGAFNWNSEYAQFCIDRALTIPHVDARRLVALEVQLGMYAGFMFFGVVSQAEFCVKRQVRPLIASGVYRCALEATAKWDAWGYPFVSMAAFKRSRSRRDAIRDALGLSRERKPREINERRLRDYEAVAVAQWAADRGVDAATLAELSAFAAAAKADSPSGCIRAWTHRGLGPCNLCAFPLPHEVVQGRHQRYGDRAHRRVYHRGRPQDGVGSDQVPGRVQLSDAEGR